MASRFNETKTALRKQEHSHGLPYSEMPLIFAYFGLDGVLDLHRWSMIVSNLSMKNIAKLCQDYQSSSAMSVAPCSEKGADLIKGPLRVLDISSAKAVSDTGLKAVVSVCPDITILKLSQVPLISDVGLREVATHCPSLRKLYVDGNPALTGFGVAVLAECCPNLQTISMSHSTAIKPWALSKLVHGCKGLEVVNFKGCSQITDLTMKALGENCPHLRTLNLEECVEVSDAGILSISKGCGNLEAINLTRTSFEFKITDISLLALGERCPFLQEIKAGGCTYVTDVGLNWLSLGCKALVNLQLPNCNKIGNPGLRALSENCHQLEVLDFRSLNLITDIGLKHIAMGCPLLTSLNVSGGFLISDGSKRDFGCEGIQALAQGCKKLKSLHLDDCFRVQDFALRALAGALELEKLSLKDCYSIKERGICELAAGCNKLRFVDFTNCGQALTDLIIAALAQQCRGLKEVILKGCPKVSAPSIKALGKYCKKLEKLDLTGCILVDDFSMLPLAEADFNPGLKCLILDGCIKVTDTGLSWLSDRCSSLLMLNVLGTGITSRSLQAVQDVWKWSEYVKTEEKFGMFPYKRFEDRMFIQWNATRYNAATKIQALARAFEAKARVYVIRLQKLKEWLTIKLQGLVRKFLAITRVFKIRYELKIRYDAATRIQCMFRCWYAKKTRSQLNEELQLRHLSANATKIQARWRGVLGRRRFLIIKREYEDLIRRKRECALTIQRVYRGFKGRNKFREKKIEHTKMLLRRCRAAETIQAFYHGNRARARCRRMRHQRVENNRRRLCAAIAIEKTIRAYLCRQIMQKEKARKTLKAKLALLCQKYWRGYKQRKAYAFLREDKELERQEIAVSRIQRFWRGALARRFISMLKAEIEASTQDKIRKATKIQRVYRGYRGRQRYRLMKNDRAKWADISAQLEIWAAIKIQSAWRKMFAKIRVGRIRHERKTRWKEMIDDASKKKFWYNKCTGEIRWRTPQDVLDLLPRPVCGDCQFNEAVLECANCQESFCNSCGISVHKGGRRAKHEFRVFYDFYNKRVDYGESEFPSRWAEDMVQDERNGWRIKTEEECPKLALPAGASSYPSGYFLESQKAYPQVPSMLPSNQTKHLKERRESWAKYFDESASSYYYYNAITQESSYDRPLTYFSPRENLVDERQLIPSKDSWRECWDDTYKCSYYFNEITQEVSYEPPPCINLHGTRIGKNIAAA